MGTRSGWIHASITAFALLTMAGCGDGSSSSPAADTGSAGTRPADTGSAGTRPAGDGSGIAGVVTLGPQCPVIVEDEPCPDVPAGGARIAVHRADDGAPAGRPTPEGAALETVAADGDGAFSVEVGPGDYVLVTESPEAMFCEPLAVTVRRGEQASVQVLCDTGMR